MSKKYDELIRKTSKDGISLGIDPQKVIPMSPEESDFNKKYGLDADLLRELRDRTIINFVKLAIKNNIDFTYGDVLLVVDDDATEKEYEGSKLNSNVNKDKNI